MTIEAAYLAACLNELAALKPGNVHRHADGHRMTVADFERSAAVSAPFVCAKRASLGWRILSAVQATNCAVQQNTNLGIVLLCAPLAAAAEGLKHASDFGVACTAVIGTSDLRDAEQVFAAIRLARPAGLGSVSRNDIEAAATVTLAEAMAQAAPRDSIARQWSRGFEDILDGGLSHFEAARRRWPNTAWAATSVYLHYLSRWPDSHVQRKYGPETAAALQQEAKEMAASFDAVDDPTEMVGSLLCWDASLKAAGINPGTSADMTVATIFASRLQNGLPFRSDDG
jgi:triphosphoribosyl-dephospho-CoA synthase